MCLPDKNVGLPVLTFSGTALVPLLVSRLIPSLGTIILSSEMVAVPFHKPPKYIVLGVFSHISSREFMWDACFTSRRHGQNTCGTLAWDITQSTPPDFSRSGRKAKKVCPFTNLALPN